MTIIAADKQAVLAGLRAKLHRNVALLSQENITPPASGPLGPLLAAAMKPGGVIEIVGHEAGGLALAALLAKECVGSVVLIDPSRSAAPLALGLFGLDSRRLWIVRPAAGRLALWAAEASLRCPGISATLCRLGPRLPTVAARRLKLASETGGGVGLIVRPAAREPPFGDVRLAVRPLPSRGRDTLRPRLEIEAVYIRGGTEGVRCEVEISPDANLVSVVPTVARPAGPRRRLCG